MFITDLDLKLFVIMDKKKTCFRYLGSFRFEMLDIYLNCNFSFDRV